MNNCWENMHCPPERKENCPAFTGNQGLYCWRVTGTLCRGEVQGSMAEKMAACRECRHYKLLMEKNKLGGIRGRLVLGFAAILVLLALVAGLAWYQLRTVHNRSSDLLTHKAAVVSEVKSLLIAAQQETLDVRGYLLYGNQDYLNKYRQDSQLVQETLQQVRQHVTTSEGMGKLARIEKNYQVLHGYLENALQLKLTGREQELAAYVAANKGVFSNLRGAVQELIDYDQKLLKEDLRQNERAVQSTITFLLGVAVAALLLALLIAYLLARMITVPLAQLKEVSIRVAEGDLAVPLLEVRRIDECGHLMHAFNQLVVGMREMAGTIHEQTGSLTRAAETLSASAQQTASAANENTSTVEEVASTVQQVAQNVEQVAELAGRLNQQASQGQSGIQQVEGQMQVITASAGQAAAAVEQLSQQTENISQIIDLITSIAEQTNLLALNAAIEAARAGDAGRGFAVVAEEVRQLAEQSASAAKDIRQILPGIQDQVTQSVQIMHSGGRNVEAGVQLVQNVGRSLTGILQNIAELGGQIERVAGAAQQISVAVQSVAASSEEQTAAVEEVSSTAQELSAMADNLQQMAA
ncbi:MAG: methyl-accepting chemotaxis protein, partial [Bacillota bacterium]